MGEREREREKENERQSNREGKRNPVYVLENLSWIYSYLSTL